MQNLVNDIKNDDSYIFESNDDGYIITTKVNYSNNKELVSQKIYVDKDKNINLVEVLDQNGLVKLKMKINNIVYNSDSNVESFKLENNMTVSGDSDLSVSKINDVIYPMYIPQNTYLSTQDKVSIEGGERVIMTFSGDYPFMLIQETVSSNDSSIISVFGEPLQLSDSVGVIDDTSITWISDGIEYYLVSNSLNSDELISVANSMTVAAIEK